MNKAYTKKIETIKKLRIFFDEIGATEVFTPIFRKSTSPSMKRIETKSGIYLRNCQELYLRLMMEYYGDVFEIGSSFRIEAKEDEIHGCEFTLLEAQFANKKLCDLMNILKKIIFDVRPEFIFEEISVAETIKTKTGIDLVSLGESALVEYLSNFYPKFQFKHNFQIINHYIQQEIEPISRGKCVFFTEYPSCTLSLARYYKSSKEIIKRFELFINGIEISNGYENSIDIDEFVKRNKSVSMFTKEEAYLEKKLREGAIPVDTSIIGIGIERLCMVLYDISNIQLLLRENVFF